MKTAALTAFVNLLENRKVYASKIYQHLEEIGKATLIQKSVPCANL